MRSNPRLLADRYELEAPIGRGRSTVYRGMDTRLHRPVAMKEVVLASDHESLDRVRRRALREARAAAKLTNPTVVTVYDVLEEDDSIWLVMELVDAPSLSQLVAEQGPRGHAEVAGIGVDVLDALTSAHGVGVVHRDVKPANVLVGGGDHAKLADFGVATIRDDARVTATGLVIGSPAYMAPEQARGEDVGPPADLWALGATLYFAYEGVPPFDAGSAMATATAVVHGTPRPEKLPGALSPIVARLLDKDPSCRPGVGELRQTLQEVAGSTSVPTTVVAPAAPAAPATAAVPAPTGLTETVPAAGAAGAAVPAGEPGPDSSGRGLTPASRAKVSRSAIRVVVGVSLLTMAAVWALLSLDPDDPTSGDDPPTDEQSTETTAPQDPAAATPDTEPPAADDQPAAGDQGEGDDGEGDGDGDGEGDGGEGGEGDGGEQGQGAPEGWVQYTDASAYTIAYPEGWEVVPAGGPRTDFRDPETGTFLRVDWTDDPKPDPVADWQAQAEWFASNHEGYEEIGIAPYSYRDYNAALWEFRYREDGRQYHAGDLGFVAGDRGYALYFHSEESRWSEGQETFARFRESFQPA